MNGHGHVASADPARDAGGVPAGGDWQTAIRLLLAVQMLGFAFMVVGTHGAFGPQPNPPTTTDFASFYAAGLLANRGHPEAAYSAAPHRAAEAEAVAPGVEEKPFVNPPVFLLVCAVLARLPYLVAFTLFEGITFAVWLALSTRVADDGTPAAMALACIPSVYWALGWGQNSFLSASLFAAGTLLVRRRPWVAGAAFGALCFKPHLALMVPVALIAGGHWRAMIGACLSLCTLCACSALWFGLAPWRAFLTALQGRPRLEIGTGLIGHVDIGSAARLLGAPPAAGSVIQLLAFGIAVACVAWLWRRARQAGPGDGAWAWRANAGLIAGTLVASPFLLFYDLVIAGVAAAWIARCARHPACHRRVMFGFAVAASLDFLAFPAATTLHLAIAALVSPILLWLSFPAISGQALTTSQARPCNRFSDEPQW